jgi:TPR repeat protein
MRVIKVLIFVSLVLLGSVASSNTYKDGTAALEARDFEIAHFMLLEEATNNNALAQYNLGTMYHVGYGVAQDKETALMWFTKSAKLGNALAQLYLGQAYRLGDILTRNEETAIVWYTRSAMNNNAEAQFNLGALYTMGKETPRNKAEAIKWYNLAAKQGHVSAIHNLKILTDKRPILYPVESNNNVDTSGKTLVTVKNSITSQFPWFGVPLSLLISYIGFTFFLFYQTLHIRNFKGASEAYKFALNIFVLISRLFGISFLLYWGYHYSWGQIIYLYGLGLIFKPMWFYVEAKLGLSHAYWMFSLAGFIVIPICGLTMWNALP